MIEEQIRLPGVSDEENSLLNRLLKQLEQRSLRNRLRVSYYDGKRAIRQVGTVIPPQYFRLGIVLGWSAKAVDILARRCNLDGFVWPDGDVESLGLSEVWDGNALDAESNSAIVSSLIHGVAFLVNTTGGDGEPRSLVHVKDAMSATGDWNPRSRRMNNLLSVVERDREHGVTSLALYLDGKTITAVREGSGWMVNQQDHPWGVPAEALVYKPRVGRPFGMSRISRPVMSLHDQALRTVIRLEGHADVFSYPELWMLGADPSVLTGENGQPLPAWQAVLGRIKGIPDDDEAPDGLARADIRQFQAASPQPHLDALKQQAQLFSGETSIPLTSLGVSDMGNPTSADSYIASREDLISEAEGATDDWAPAFRRSIIRALAIANDESTVPDAWQSIDAKWRSPVHLSRAAQADAGMKVISAVPWLAETSVGLELLGLSDQQIDRALADRRRSSAANIVERLTGATITVNPVEQTAQTVGSGGAGGL
jgi:hypothetical protein